MIGGYLKQKNQGFTIVELVIIIIVIGILAAITIVSYGAVTENAARQTLEADIRSAASKLTRYKSENGSYPQTLDTAGISNTSSTAFYYDLGPDPSIDRYCLSGAAGQLQYHIVNGNSNIEEGPCNL